MIAMNKEEFSNSSSVPGWVATALHEFRSRATFNHNADFFISLAVDSRLFDFADVQADPAIKYLHIMPCTSAVHQTAGVFSRPTLCITHSCTFSCS